MAAICLGLNELMSVSVIDHSPSTLYLKKLKLNPGKLNSAARQGILLIFSFDKNMIWGLSQYSNQILYEIICLELFSPLSNHFGILPVTLSDYVQNFKIGQFEFEIMMNEISWDEVSGEFPELQPTPGLITIWTICLKIRYCKSLFLHSFFVNQWIGLNFCTEHGS